MTKYIFLFTLLFTCIQTTGLCIPSDYDFLVKPPPVIPEPSSLILLATGILGIFFTGKNK